MRFRLSGRLWGLWLCLALGLWLAFSAWFAGDSPAEASASMSVQSTATATLTRTPTATRTRTPGSFRNYLPLLFKPLPLPGTPALQAINNADGDANYLVVWGPAARAQTYQLQEDDNASFSSPTLRYSGSETYYSVTRQAPGTWYYRVRGCHSGGCGGWSNVQSVFVSSCPYVDDFSNPASGWPVKDVTGEYRAEYLNGEYRILVRRTNSWIVGTPGYRCADCSIEVQGRFASANYGGYGILFGISDAWDAYLFQVSGTQYYNLRKLQNNRWQELVPWTRATAIKAGEAVNHLRVVRNGAQIALYANSQLLTTVSDASFRGDLRVGLAVSSYEQANVDARFDNFRVCSVTEGSALLSMSPGLAEVRSLEAGPRP